MKLALSAAVAMLLLPAGAHASTVVTRDYQACGDEFCEPYDNQSAVRFELTAAPGERNDVRIEPAAGGRVRVIDRAAPLSAADGCEPAGAHEAICRESWMGIVALGDGDDALAVVWAGEVAAYGGDGDDALAGGDTKDVIDGGPGSDRLLGGGGDDRLTSPEPADTVDGGDGTDVVDYSEERAPQRIALGRMRDVENAVGGRDDDTIIGNDARNFLSGFSGNDRLRGGGGPDELGGDSGQDELFGGPGDDRFRTRDKDIDYIGCGRGRDVVRDDLGIYRPRWAGPDAADRIAEDCERVAETGPREARPLLLDPRVRGFGRRAAIVNPCRALRARHCRGTLSAFAGDVLRVERFSARPRLLHLILPPGRDVRVTTSFAAAGGTRHVAQWTADR